MITNAGMTISNYLICVSSYIIIMTEMAVV